MKAILPGLCAVVFAVSSNPLLAADPASAATTLAPVSVHASDTMVMETPSVRVRVSRTQLQQQNVTESADALKYAPNMMVRKRYIGDPNAVISGRNAGTLQSARSLVYADGLLLSNLMTNGYDGAPRWGMVAPEEIGAVDILYGPYSALYPGNSLGTTVLIHTVLPQQFTASASTQFFSQDFHDAYGAGGHYNGHQLAATLGGKQGRWSWLLELSRLDNDGQPLQYATAKAGGNPAIAVPVTGATPDRNPNGTPRLVYGANSIEHTMQTQAKLKVGVDVTERIATLFTAASVESVLERLVREDSAFARQAVTAIRANSPTSLKLAFHLLYRGATLDLRQCLAQEYRAAAHLLARHDIQEGVRAALIDKDRAPKWQPSALAAVTEAGIAALMGGEPEIPAFE